jgi:hypothetical protein
MDFHMFELPRKSMGDNADRPALKLLKERLRIRIEIQIRIQVGQKLTIRKPRQEISDQARLQGKAVIDDRFCRLGGWEIGIGRFEIRQRNDAAFGQGKLNKAFMALFIETKDVEMEFSAMPFQGRIKRQSARQVVVIERYAEITH